MCGVFGVYGHPEAAKMTYLGLYALQHRGQESAGIVSSDGIQLRNHRGMGLVADLFNEEILKKRLKGLSAIGHVRYSTTGGSLLKNAQPFVVDYARGSIAIAHNGNLTNTQIIKDELEAKGSIFQSNMDTEIIVHLIARSKKKSLVDKIVDALKTVQGAYSLLLLTDDRMIAVRDPRGVRPLSIGNIKGACVLASETCAFDLVGAEGVREVEPGELILVDRNGVKSFKPFEEVPASPCVFEFIYFARPDSVMFGKSVHSIRKDMGRQLAKEEPVEADVVIPVPDSGVSAAMGYSEESGIPYETGLIRNHYVGRTFIEPRQSIRHFGVKIKLNPVRDVLEGKRVIVVDDSIVRGTTSRKIVTMLKKAGAREVHMRISAPATKFPCFYGIDTPTRQELVAATHSLKEINTYLGSDSLVYLSVDGLLKVVGMEENYCKACFTGDYPIAFHSSETDIQMALFR
ncbi:MAG: amidophosphoribosyltransferase [Thermodesulfobacteriota bacterium]